MVNHENDTLLLVTGSRFTQASLANQLRELIPEEVTIMPYLMDEGHTTLEGRYFTVFSSEEVYKEFCAQELEKHLGQFVIGTRTIVAANIGKVLSLPRDQEVLLVTDSKISALENMQLLQDMGFDFLKLVPYYPGSPAPDKKIKIAITPGDHNQVPQGVESVFNMGTRLFDLATLAKILARYDLLEEKIDDCEKKYAADLFHFAAQISNVAEETSKVMKTVRKELAGSGYFAKYHFDDIIGESKPLMHTKSIAQKIAKTDLTMLIEGEDGTGKELFASAIHNASERSREPFIAINCSALPDQLIESELFGYEEGAFTGARKGGKIGLFQQASGGTIFLDEIGDISLKMQAKLLRALEQREIMRVGGDRIIPIDVRIIAATNRDLKTMIEEKTFRKDLYYRLREGFIYIPPLCERKQDIPLLVKYWEEKRFQSSKEISPEVMQYLMHHHWPGNARELLNVMKYAFAVSEGDTITLNDLPLDPQQVKEMMATPQPQVAQLTVDDVSLQILKAIEEINQKEEIAGRNRISLLLMEKGFDVSEYRIRKVIAGLTAKNLIEATDGKYGLVITQNGLDAIKTSELQK